MKIRITEEQHKGLIGEISFDYDEKLQMQNIVTDYDEYKYDIDFGSEIITYNFYYDHVTETIDISFYSNGSEKEHTDYYHLSNDSSNIFRKIGEIKRGYIKSREYFESQRLIIRGIMYSPTTDKRGKLYGHFVKSMFPNAKRYIYDMAIYLIFDLHGWKVYLSQLYNAIADAGKNSLKKNGVNVFMSELPFDSIEDLGLHQVQESKLNGNLTESNRFNDIYRRHVKKIKSEGVGYAGSISDVELINPKVFYKYVEEFDDYFQYNYDDEDYENLSNQFGDNTLYVIWKQYADAMGRERPDSVLDIERFVYYIKSYPNIMLYEDAGSYVIGHYRNGFFKPSHFAPKNIRAGVQLINSLVKYDNIIFAVTGDLKNMLVKMGLFTTDSLIIPMIFRDMVVEKSIVFTNPEIMANILIKLEGGEIGSIDDFEDIGYGGLTDKVPKQHTSKYDDYDEIYGDK